MLIDIHVHLQEKVLREDIGEVMQACREEGVALQACNGTRPGDWAAVADLADRYPEVLPCFGVHPWYVGDAEKESDWEGKLRGFLDRYPYVPVGEIGIDRWIEPRDEALQERMFRRQLQIATEMDRPAMVHCLRAWGWLLEILEGEGEKRPGKMLIHSFGGSAEMIRPLKEMGAYFSFAGSIFEPKRQKLRDACKAVPRERLLIETDAPALIAPAEHRKYHVVDEAGEVQNHPANLPWVYVGVAELIGCSVQELRDQVASNAREFLGKSLEAWNARG